MDLDCIVEEKVSPSLCGTRFVVTCSILVFFVGDSRFSKYDKAESIRWKMMTVIAVRAIHSIDIGVTRTII